MTIRQKLFPLIDADWQANNKVDTIGEKVIDKSKRRIDLYR